MLDLDGTPNKANLGANAILAVSLATARASAAALDIPLFRYLGGPSARVLPVPMLNVLNGGVHAANDVDIQEFMVVPAGFPSFSEALRAGVEIYQALKKVLGGRGLSTNVGDEGGFAPNLAANRDALEVLMEATESAGYAPGEQVAFALDVAASEIYREGRYQLEGTALKSEEFVDYLEGLVADVPAGVHRGRPRRRRLGWLEDPHRSHRAVGPSWSATTPSSPTRSCCARASTRASPTPSSSRSTRSASLSETLHTMEMAEDSSYAQVVSHRSGETEDSFISHLAVATNAGQIKTGAPARGERTAKYNQLLRIEERLGDQARYAGWGAYGKVG